MYYLNCLIDNFVSLWMWISWLICNVVPMDFDIWVWHTRLFHSIISGRVCITVLKELTLEGMQYFSSWSYQKFALVWGYSPCRILQLLSHRIKSVLLTLSLYWWKNRPSSVKWLAWGQTVPWQLSLNWISSLTSCSELSLLLSPGSHFKSKVL